MSWFAVRDEDGKYWDFEGMDDYRKPLSATNRGHKWAEEVKANTGGSEIIEVVEKPTPVVVSQEEADMLKKAKDTTVWRPAAVISDYAYNAAKDSNQEVLLEDRLMRAYVIGWTVEKTKQYNVKVPHSTDGYYWRGISGQVHTYTEPDQHARVLKTDAYIWTQKQIDDADLQDCEKVECKQDED